MIAIAHRPGFYVLRRCACVILAMLAIFAVLLFILEFLELSRVFSGSEQYSLAHVATVSLLRIPETLELTLQFAVLFGAMTGFATLNHSNEIVVMRAAGLSVWQFARPVAVFAFILGLAASLLGSALSDALSRKADLGEAALSGELRSLRGLSPGSAWMRQNTGVGPAIFKAGRSFDEGRLLLDVTVFVYDETGSLASRIDAPSAQYTDGAWHFRDAVRHSRDGIRSEPDTLIITAPPGAMLLPNSYQALSLWRLPGLIARAREAGLPPHRYVLRLHNLLAQPFLLVAMTMIAAALSLRPARLGGGNLALPGGAIAGFSLYIFIKLADDLGGTGILPPELTAWISALAGLCIGTSLLLYTEDG